MSKRKPLSSKTVEDYDSDDGFVEDGRASKKRKSEPKAKKELKAGVQTDDEGNEYWELSGKRRVQISEWKGTTMIGIREFYEKDGKTLPGKGISLPVDQYTTLISLLPDIERVLKAKGTTVPRPQYGKVAAPADDEDEDDEEEEEYEEVEATKPKSKGKLEKFTMKPNHEATSDEDED